MYQTTLVSVYMRIKGRCRKCCRDPKGDGVEDPFRVPWEAPGTCVTGQCRAPNGQRRLNGNPLVLQLLPFLSYQI